MLKLNMCRSIKDSSVSFNLPIFKNYYDTNNLSSIKGFEISQCRSVEHYE